MKELKLDKKLNSALLKDILQLAYKRVKVQENHIFTLSKGIDLKVHYFIPSRKTAVLFQGPNSYTKARTQTNEAKLDLYCSGNGITLIKVPFYLQPTKEVILYLFDKKLPVMSYFRSGFHYEPITLIDFNSVGQKKLFNEVMFLLEQAPDAYFEVLDSIYDSLKRIHSKHFPEEHIINTIEYFYSPEWSELLSEYHNLTTGDQSLPANKMSAFYDLVLNSMDCSKQLPC